VKLKVFTLRFSGSTEGFDDQPLQEFIADKEVIEFSEHFFIHENSPYLTILIAYRALESRDPRKGIRPTDPRFEFDGVEKEAYDALRAWRAAAAKMEGIPPYSGIYQPSSFHHDPPFVIPAEPHILSFRQSLSRNPGLYNEQATSGIHFIKQKERHYLCGCDVRPPQAGLGASKQFGGRFYQTLWCPSAGLV
jgi:hypothetical protein